MYERGPEELVHTEPGEGRAPGQEAMGSGSLAGLGVGELKAP